MKKRKWLILLMVLIYLFTLPIAGSFANLRSFSSSDSFSPVEFVVFKTRSLWTGLNGSKWDPWFCDEVMKFYRIDFKELYGLSPEETVRYVSKQPADRYGLKVNGDVDIYDGVVGTHDERFELWSVYGSSGILPEGYGATYQSLGVESLIIEGVGEVKVKNIYSLTSIHGEYMVIYDTDQGLIYALFFFSILPIRDFETVKQDQLGAFERDGVVIYMNEETFEMYMENVKTSRDEAIQKGESFFFWLGHPDYNPEYYDFETLNVTLQYRDLTQKQRAAIAIAIWTVAYVGIIIGAYQIYKRKRKPALADTPSTEEVPEKGME